MSRSQAIDMHCDTLMVAYMADGETGEVYSRKDTMVDVKRLHEAGAMAQCFAIWMVPDVVYKDFLKREPVPEDTYIKGCTQVLNNTVAHHSDVVAHAYNAEDVERNYADGKVSAILTMEDAVACHGDLGKIDEWYKMGVRFCTLTWNFENSLGAPNSKDPEIMKKGLTEFGREAVQHMQEIGMIVDVSHVSDGVFWDCIKLCRKPIVATHSNCRALSPRTRNMTDDMVKALAENGGIMGINFGPEFLNEDENNHASTVERMVASAQHIKDLTGSVDCIGLGSDFDGISGDLEVGSCSDMYKLKDGLIKGGFTAEEVDKIFYKNALRVMREDLK
jgi:membrane dipeptidase